MICAKKNLWLLPDQYCIVRGNAVACNLMFESKNDHKIFLDLWDKYLGGMTEVINYHLSPTDWTILFKARSREEIIQAYHQQRIISKKAKKECTLQEPKRMLSEHMRIFLSQYVRKTNARTGRKGTKVLERFQKYVLKSHADFKEIFSIISNQIRIQMQSQIRYRADERLYDMKKEMEENSIYKVGRILYEGVRSSLDKGYEGVRCMRLMRPNSSVLRNFFAPQNQTKKSFNSS